MKTLYFFLIPLIFISCSKMEESEKQRIRKCNEVSEIIYRHHDEVLFAFDKLSFQDRTSYPWEQNAENGLLKITKEFFRCRGSQEHPPSVIDGKTYTDCGGNRKHGLPYKNGQEFVYPVLLDLLNHVQKMLGAKVVITSGYRCPIHNTYVNPSSNNQTSKHQIGATVDFYVIGYEESPFEVIKAIMEFYQNKGDTEFLPFHKTLSKGNKHPTWYNKEISIKVYDKKEGRDFDNRHPYPYIALEVRYDRGESAILQYDWKTAHQGYLRY